MSSLGTAIGLFLLIIYLLIEELYPGFGFLHDGSMVVASVAMSMVCKCVQWRTIPPCLQTRFVY